MKDYVAGGDFWCAIWRFYIYVRMKSCFDGEVPVFSYLLSMLALSRSRSPLSIEGEGEGLKDLVMYKAK